MRNEMVAGTWQVRQTALEISLSALKRNYETLAKAAGSAEMLVLLKSDAYGHSHQEVAKALDSLPTDCRLHGFGVANLEEGIELRRIRVGRRVYVLSGIQHFDDDMYRCLSTCRITPVVSSLPVLRELDRLLQKNGESQVVHLKFNTGMNRLGFDLEELPEIFSILEKNQQIKIEGVMSHYSSAEKKNSALTKRQTETFRGILGKLRSKGIQPQYHHLSNSSGLKNHCYPEGNIVRVGLHLYGVGNRACEGISRWTAQVYQIRDLRKGEAVGYGPLFRSKRRIRMAVLGVGYSDGYRRALSNRAEVLIHGKRCPVIGAVSMDLTSVDVTHVKEITTGSRAVLLGRDGKECISAEELASHARCIPYEIITGISPRVPRVFSA